MFIVDSDFQLTEKTLSEYIKKHGAQRERYERLKNLYEGKHAILDQKKKQEYKPDNRLVVNYAKYIVDTLNGFFIGIPIKLEHENKTVCDYLNFIDGYNNQDDNNAELSKTCSIYGHAFEMLFADDSGNIGITYIDPMQCFILYDNSIVRHSMYAVRYYQNTDAKTEGSFSDAFSIQYFHDDGGIIFDELVPHYFGDVPIIEYLENEERQAAFENVESLINAYNKAISEKANDVDYFADAYLKILGTELDTATIDCLRDSRIINIGGADSDKLVVEFMQKPDGDATQENLIDRLGNLIFQISMVANINDKEFGSATGISLKYKLQSMLNLAKTKERKFIAGMNKRYKMVSNFPSSKLSSDDWIKLSYQFTRNIPNNLLEESQIASNLSGITSQETQLKVLSVVNNVTEEIEKMNAQIDPLANDFPRQGNALDE